VTKERFPSEGPKEKQTAFVAKILGTSERDLKFSRLAPGTTNLCFLAEAKGKKYVIRVFGEGTGVIINRDRELTNLVRSGCGKVFARFANGAVLG
jgi:hypothetical protein